MNHKSPRTHDQTYWHTSDSLDALTHSPRAKNIRAREPHKPSALKRAKRSSARVRPRCPRKSSSTMSMNVRPLQKTEVRDQGSNPHHSLPASCRPEACRSGKLAIGPAGGAGKAKFRDPERRNHFCRRPKMVEPIGIEPTTSSLQSSRSPN